MGRRRWRACMKSRAGLGGSVPIILAEENLHLVGSDPVDGGVRHHGPAEAVIVLLEPKDGLFQLRNPSAHVVANPVRSRPPDGGGVGRRSRRPWKGGEALVKPGGRGGRRWKIRRR